MEVFEDGQGDVFGDFGAMDGLVAFLAHVVHAFVNGARDDVPKCVFYHQGAEIGFVQLRQGGIILVHPENGELQCHTAIEATNDRGCERISLRFTCGFCDAVAVGVDEVEVGGHYDLDKLMGQFSGKFGNEKRSF